MFARPVFQVLVSAVMPDGWILFHQTHTCDSEQDARDLVLDHPAAGPQEWHIVEVRTVPSFPLSTLDVAA